MVITWSSDHSVIYQDIHLHLAIVNDLSIAIEFTRINQKASLMQLGINLTPINLMYNYS
jgi:hypothetical protein